MTKAATLASVTPRTPQRPRSKAATKISAGCRRLFLAAKYAGQRRQQHQRQHHRQILDDQPADRDAAALGLDQPALLQRAQQHDRRGDRKRKAENEACADGPAKSPGEARAQHCCEGDLNDSSRHGDGADRKKILQREMQADAEHQQDDADLRKFERQRLVGDETGRVRPDEHAGYQIADEGRNAEAVCQSAEDESQPQAGDDCCDKRRLMRHRLKAPFNRDQELMRAPKGLLSNMVDRAALAQPRPSALLAWVLNSADTRHPFDYRRSYETQLGCLQIASMSDTAWLVSVFGISAMILSLTSRCSFLRISPRTSGGATTTTSLKSPRCAIL